MNAFQEQCKSTLISKGYVKHYELKHTSGWFIGLWVCIIICIVLAITSGVFAIIPAIGAVVCSIVSYVNYKHDFALLQDRWLKYLKESGEGEKLLGDLFETIASTQKQTSSTPTYPRVLCSDTSSGNDENEDDDGESDLDDDIAKTFNNEVQIKYFKELFFMLKDDGKKKLEMPFDSKYSIVNDDENTLLIIDYYKICYKLVCEEHKKQYSESNLLAVDFRVFDNTKVIVMYFDGFEHKVAKNDVHTIVLTLDATDLSHKFYAIFKEDNRIGTIIGWNEYGREELENNRIKHNPADILGFIFGYQEPNSDVPFTITPEQKKTIQEMLKVPTMGISKYKNKLGWDRDKINEFNLYMIANGGMTQRYDKRFGDSVLVTIDNERLAECLDVMVEGAKQNKLSDEDEFLITKEEQQMMAKCFEKGINDYEIITNKLKWDILKKQQFFDFLRDMAYFDVEGGYTLDDEDYGKLVINKNEFQDILDNLPLQLDDSDFDEEWHNECCENVLEMIDEISKKNPTFKGNQKYTLKDIDMMIGMSFCPITHKPKNLCQEIKDNFVMHTKIKDNFRFKHDFTISEIKELIKLAFNYEKETVDNDEENDFTKEFRGLEEKQKKALKGKSADEVEEYLFGKKQTPEERERIGKLVDEAEKMGLVPNRQVKRNSDNANIIQSFGLNPDNPICLTSVSNSYAYLNFLKCSSKDEEIINKVRQGSIPYNNVMIDKWQITIMNKKQNLTQNIILYINGYARHDDFDKAPNGFTMLSKEMESRPSLIKFVDFEEKHATEINKLRGNGQSSIYDYINNYGLPILTKVALINDRVVGAHWGVCDGDVFVPDGCCSDMVIYKTNKKLWEEIKNGLLKSLIQKAKEKGFTKFI